MRFSCLLILKLLITGTLNAQSVDSRAFQLTLDALLEKDVPGIEAKASELENALILDARELNEFKVSHIKTAKWIGPNMENDKLLNGIPKNQRIIVYCSIGYRSEIVTRKLIDKGYHNVYNLFGGIFEWKNRGHPVYKGNTPTDSIHAYNHLWGFWLDNGTKVYD